MFARIAPLLLFVTLAAVSCNVSPQPVPPPDISVSALTVDEPTLGTLRVVGAPGAVAPAGSPLRITNIGNVSGTASRVETTVASDGSFSAEIAGSLGDHLKLSVLVEENVPEPVVVDTADGIAAEAVQFDCVLILPEEDQVAFPLTAVDFTSTVNVVVENNCDDDIIVNETTFALDEGSYTTDFVTPATITVDDATAIPVEYGPSAEGDHEDVLVIEIELNGQLDIRVLDLYGEAL